MSAALAAEHSGPSVPGYAIGDCLDVLRGLPDQWAHMCVTSPPYWGLRDYGHDGQLGLEETPEAYVARMVEVFAEVRRVLRDDGTLWLNIGDSYAGSWGNQGRKSERGHQRAVNGDMLTPVHDGRFPSKASNTGTIPEGSGIKPKDLVGIPWRLAFALQADGWYLRSDIIWHKPNPMPESVTDRPTKAHEYVFLLAKSARYYYDADAVREAGKGLPSGNGFAGRQGGARQTAVSGGGGRDARHEPGSGRNKRTVWTTATESYSGAHFACYPPELIKPCVMAGCPEGGIVLDPFFGSGTTGRVAEDLGRRWFGIELNPEYEPLIKARTAQRGLL